MTRLRGPYGWSRISRETPSLLPLLDRLTDFTDDRAQPIDAVRQLLAAPTLQAMHPYEMHELAMQGKVRKKRPVTSPPNGSEIDLGWLGGTIGFNLRVAQEASVRAYLRSVADTGHLAWRFAILAFIDLNPGLTQAALARAVMRDTSSLTAVLDDLCERKLVTRIRPNHDRRSYALRITAAGLRAMNELKAKVQAHEKELDSLFTKDQRSALIQLLRRITSVLSAKD